MEFKDYYRILGVPRTATSDEIRKAYRKLARQHHPDVNPGNRAAEERFKDLNEANEVLADAQRRKAYDEAYEAWRTGRQPPTAGARTGRGPAEHASYRTVSAEDLRDLYGEGTPYSDFFSSLFGEGRGATRGPRRGADLEYPLAVSLAEAYSGGRRLLEVQQPDGSTRRVEATIPPGVRDGTRVRMPGLGGPGDPPGDLYLEVGILEDPAYRREGDDLVSIVPVPLTTAALGGDVTVVKPDGRRLSVRVPAGTQDGRRIRLRGQGMPRSAGRGDDAPRGDLLAEVHLRLPDTLTEAQRRLFQQLREEGA